MRPKYAETFYMCKVQVKYAGTTYIRVIQPSAIQVYSNYICGTPQVCRSFMYVQYSMQ
jgi:hypothetical protein